MKQHKPCYLQNLEGWDLKVAKLWLIAGHSSCLRIIQIHWDFLRTHHKRLHKTCKFLQVSRVVHSKHLQVRHIKFFSVSKHEMLIVNQFIIIKNERYHFVIKSWKIWKKGGNNLWEPFLFSNEKESFFTSWDIYLVLIKNKGKESENSYQILKRSRWTGTRTHTRKQNQNISTDTGIFLNQKRANICEHMTKMVSLEFLKGATRRLQEEWMRLMPGLCLEDRMNWYASSRWRRVIWLWSTGTFQQELKGSWWDLDFVSWLWVEIFMK